MQLTPTTLDTQIRLWENLGYDSEFAGDMRLTELARQQRDKFMNLHHDRFKDAHTSTEPYTIPQLLDLAKCGRFSDIAELTQFRDAEIHGAAWHAHGWTGFQGYLGYWEAKAALIKTIQGKAA